MSINKKRKDVLTNAAYKRGSGRNTSAVQDYNLGGIGMVSADGASAAVDSVNRQESIENAQDKRQAENKKARKLQLAKEALSKKAKKKDEDANDSTLKQYPELKRKR